MKTIILAPDHTYKDDPFNPGTQVEEITAPFVLGNQEHFALWHGADPTTVTIWKAGRDRSILVSCHDLGHMNQEDALCTAVQQFVGDKYSVMLDKD